MGVCIGRVPFGVDDPVAQEVPSMVDTLAVTRSLALVIACWLSGFHISGKCVGRPDV